MIELGPCEITGIFGPMRSGKTHQINTWLNSNHSLCNRVVRFDVTGETLDMGGWEHIWASPKELYQRIQSNPYCFRIAYHPGDNLEEDFKYVVRVLTRFDVFKLLVCDEWHEICPVNQTPVYVRKVLRYARHDRLAIIGASQRFADVHKLFVAGCAIVIVFYSDEYRDYVALQNKWGTEVAEAMRGLRPLIYNDVTKETLQIPQALVSIDRARPRIYDYETGQFIEIQGASKRQLRQSTEPSGAGDNEEGSQGDDCLTEETELQSSEGESESELT